MKSLLALALAAGCAHQPESSMRLTGPTMEMQLDNGAPTEKTQIPNKQAEQLVRFEPRLGHFIPLRMRFLLAQAGHVVFVFYATAGKGDPGPEIGRLDRDYDAQLVSDGNDGRWVVEELTLPPQRAPLWIGLSSTGASALWTSPNASGNVFARDGATPLSSNKVLRTPVLRLEVAPALPPGTPPK